MSEQIAELATALAKAQAAVSPAVKDKTNPAFRSRYADLSSVWEACREALTSNGLSVVQMPINHAEGYAALRTMLLHTSGQWLATTVSARLIKDDAQGLGSALTYLRRYSLAAMVGVVADEDDDGNAAASRGPSPQRSAPRTDGPPTRPPRPSEPLRANFNPEEAERRFYEAWGDVMGGKTWRVVQQYLGAELKRPESADDWIAVARKVRDRNQHQEEPEEVPANL
jgi:hypothetical protein